MSSKSIGELARSRSLDYVRSARKRKGEILDEFVAATGVKRKTAISMLRDPPPVRARPRGRPTKRYGPDVSAALEMLWAVDGYVCSARLVPALPLLVHLVVSEGSWGFSDGVREKLLRISVSTCERLLRPHKAAFRPQGRCLTRPGSMLKSQIPVRTWADWIETEPGYCEMDLVHHCDNDTWGEYVHTLSVTDVLLGWTPSGPACPIPSKGWTPTAEASSSTPSCTATVSKGGSSSPDPDPRGRTTSAASSRRTAPS
jgi:hypothetical protein